MTTPENPKAAPARTKVSMSAVPAGALAELACVMDLGARKYGRLNWRETGVDPNVYIDAIYRHLLKWQSGEEMIDPESGMSHLAHVMACCSILVDVYCLNPVPDIMDRTL